MRFLLTLGLLACVIACAWAAFSEQDQEIFRLREEVEAAEGLGTTFYEFIGVKRSASHDEIQKAFRKKSQVLHPDKLRRDFDKEKQAGKARSKAQQKAAAKAASDRYARLGVVKDILKGSGRQRYDHYLSNGFPKWKATGYLYERFRPGLGSVLLGLFIAFGGGGHWLALYMQSQRDRDLMRRYIEHARRAAGSNVGIPGLDGAAGTATPPVDDDENPAQILNRRQKRMQDKMDKKEKTEKKSKKAAKFTPPGTPPVGGARRRVVADNGKVLAIDQAGNVYMEQEDEDGITQQYLLDLDEYRTPTIKDTALVKLPVWIFNSVAGRFLSKASAGGEVGEEAEEEGVASGSSGADDFELLDKDKVKTAPNGSGKAVRRNKKTARR